MQVAFKMFINSLWKRELTHLEASWKAAAQRLTSQTEFLRIPQLWEEEVEMQGPPWFGDPAKLCQAHTKTRM